MRGRKILALLLAIFMILGSAGVFAEGGMWSPIENRSEREGSEGNVDFAKIVDYIGDRLRSDNSFSNVKKSLWEKDKEEGTVVLVLELEGKSSVEAANLRGVALEEMSDSEAIERDARYEQQDLLSVLQEKGIEYTVKEQYTTVLNAIAVELKIEDVEKLEELSGLRHVYAVNTYRAPEVTEQKRMYFSHDMINDKSAWNNGYMGEGSVVAVLDTGADVTHKDFQTLTDLSRAKLDEAKVAALIEEKGLPGRYVSPKFPYGYNYFENSHQLKNNDEGPHGQHVSGTVGANGEIKGVAPESQILVMKVFGEDPFFGSTMDYIYVKAIDDAVKLGADVINMSLGSPAGFYDENNPTNKAITNAVENGVVFAISAGNSGATPPALGNYETPDISTVGAPSLFKDSTSVASIDNLKYSTAYIQVDEARIPYMTAKTPQITDLTEEYEYVDCGKGFDGVDEDGNPAAKDFEGKDLKGKVALIQRGGCTFTFKVSNAEKNGAVAAIIYNNAPGTISMSLDAVKIPAVSITQKDGEMMLSKIETGKNKVSFPKKEGIFDSPTAGQISMFSSWGPTPDLGIKPEITAPGGDIYSTLNDDTYGMMSGTSMAAPHVAGAYAVVSQYIREKLSDFKYTQVTKNTNTGLREIPNKSFIVGNKAFSEAILQTSKSQLLYDALQKNPRILYKKDGKFFDKNGEAEFEMPSDMTYYNSQGERFVINASFGESNGMISSEPLTKGDTARLAKVLLMNTAEMLTKEVQGYVLPVSPRQQGAGLMNVGAAVSTPAVLLDSTTNEPKIELKNIEDTKFDLNLRVVNSSDKELSYLVDTLTAADLIISKTAPPLSVPMRTDAEGPKEITVPANGYVDFMVTVDFSKENPDRNMYVEGFVQLTDKDKLNPALTMPFLGFYGQYAELKTLYPWYVLGEEDSFPNPNELPFGCWLYGGVDPEYGEGFVSASRGPAYVNPNPTEFIKKKAVNNFSALTMIYGATRNLSELQTRILDASGEREIGTLRTQLNVRKRMSWSPTFAATFDGTINGRKIPDGKYMYEVRAKAAMPSIDWESKMASVIVDGTAPKLNVEVNGTNLNYDFEDETTSVLMALLTTLDDAPVDVKLYTQLDENRHPIGMKSESGSWDLTKYLKDGGFEGKLFVIDELGNYSVKRVSAGEDKEVPRVYVHVKESTEPDAATILEPYQFFDAKTEKIQVKFSVLGVSRVPKAYVNGGEVFDPEFVSKTKIYQDDDPYASRPVILDEGAAYVFSTEIPVAELKQGLNDIVVRVVTENGEHETKVVRPILFDSGAPELTVEVLERKSGSDKAVVSVNVRDEVSPELQLYVNSSHVKSIEVDKHLDQWNGVEKTFTLELDLEDGENVFEFKLVDAFGNEVVEMITITK